MAESVKSVGRLILIDPNELAGIENSQDGTINDGNISWNQEDLQYSVDLQVIIPNRSDCSMVDTMERVKTTIDNNGGGMVNNYISFLTGNLKDENNSKSPNYLTDSYTDISYQTITSDGIGQKETLGINSINIDFSSNFYPLVKINFTDVRGSALFSPTENEYRLDSRNNSLNSNERTAIDKQITASSFFKALFRFPYPKFLLTIKGYYGDKVTFILAVSDFNSSFNSDTGNFDVTVSFIGYMYGLYTDIPMNLVLAAPYYNKKYWDNNTQDGKPFHYIKNGQEGSKIQTFVEFLRNYNNLVDNINSSKLENYTDLSEYKVLNEKKDNLEALKNYYELILKQILDEGECSKLTIEGDKNTIYFSKNKGEVNINTNNLNHFRKLYEELVNRYNIKDDKTFINATFYTMEGNGVFREMINGDYKWYDDTELGNIKYFVDNKANDDSGLKEEFQRVFPSTIPDTTKKAYKDKYYFIHKHNGFLTNIENEIKTTASEINKLQDSVDNDIKKILTEAIGFDITIENVYRMIFAHIDTFINSYNNILGTISHNRKRTYSRLGLNYENSDMPTKYTSNTTVPPFPSFFLKNVGTYDKESIYPGDRRAPSSLRDIEEVNYIDEIFDAVQSYGQDLNDAIKRIEANSEENTVNFKKSSPIDYFYGDNNPYEKLLSIEATNGKVTAEEILYFLYCRAAASLLTKSSKTDNATIIDTEIENLVNIGFVIDEETKGKLRSASYNDLVNYYKANSGRFIIPVFGERETKQLNNKKYDCFLTFTDAFNDSKNVDDGISKKKNELTGLNILRDESLAKSMIDEYGDDGDKNISLWFNNGEKYEENFTKLQGSEVTSKGVNQSGYKENYDKVSNGSTDTSHYFPFIGVGEKEKAVDRRENLYLGRVIKETSDEKPIIEMQTDIYVKSLLFLSSMMACFNSIGDNIKKFKKTDSIIFEAPKLVTLYIGCILFFNSENGKKHSQNIVYKDYVIDKNNADRYFDDNKNLKYNRIFNNDGVIFGKYTPGLTINGLHGSKDFDWLKEDITSAEKLRKYYEEWVSDEFKYINNQLTERQTRNEDIEIIEYKLKTHNVKLKCWKKDSVQSELLKKLIGETVYILNVKINENQKDIKSSISSSMFTKLSNKANSLKTKEEEEQNNEENSINNMDKSVELKRALYYTLKLLYDKWLCTYTADQFKLKTVRQDLNARKKRFGTKVDGYDKTCNSEFNSFLFIDSCYNDIGSEFLVNPEVLVHAIKEHMPSLNGYENKDVYSFMADIAEKSKLLFMSLPVFSNFYDVDCVKNIFTPQNQYGINPATSDRGIGNTYVLIYTGEASTKTNDDESDYPSDCYDFGGMMEPNKPIIPSEFSTHTNDGSLKYNIPAFMVTYARQNQMYFKKINVDMTNPKVTDYSIANLLSIANGGAHGDDVNAYGIGQNIYSIYSNRSYTCTVEMMGCMNIMPTMLFQLNGIPMFRGLYYIYNVSHNIVQGNMTTKFTGVRISKEHLGNVKFSFDYQSLYNKIKGGIGSENIKPNTNAKLDEYDIWPVGGPITSDSKEEKARMETKLTDIDIKVWASQTSEKVIKLKNVNTAIAEKIKSAFEEIHDTYFTNENGKKEHIVIDTLEAYCWRKTKTKNSQSLSNHSYGIALDVNAAVNPMVNKTVYDNDPKKNTDKKDYYKDSSKQFRTWNHPLVKILNKYGFGWGIFTDRYDFMHFSFDTFTRGNNLIGK